MKKVLDTSFTIPDNTTAKKAQHICVKTIYKRRVMKFKSRSNKFITVLAMISLVAMYFVNTTAAYAGALNTKSLLPSSSAVGGTTVTYTVTFRPTVTTTITQVLVKFCTESGATYAATCTQPTGMAFTNNASSVSGFGITGGPNTIGTPTFAASILTVPVTGAGTEVTGTDHIMTVKNMTNPTNAGGVIVYARIQTNAGTDFGQVLLATIPTVSVTGQQLETLTAAVTAKTTGTICTGASLLGTTTATAIDFGTFGANKASTSAGQTVTLASNAVSGVSAKVVEDQLLTGPSSNTIADFGTTGDIQAGTAWAEATSIGFGVCAATGNAEPTNFGSATLYKAMLTTAKTVAKTSAPSSSTATNVEFRVAADTVLPAGTYTNTLTYTITANY